MTSWPILLYNNSVILFLLYIFCCFLPILSAVLLHCWSLYSIIVNCTIVALKQTSFVKLTDNVLTNSNISNALLENILRASLSYASVSLYYRTKNTYYINRISLYLVIVQDSKILKNETVYLRSLCGFRVRQCMPVSGSAE